MNPTDLINYANAIKSIESSGGNYGLTGPVTRNGDRAYGAYQVMGNNIPGWTQKHFGQSLTPQQFLANKEAQDAVFNGEFGGYVSKYGNPQDAASTWFTGRPLAQGGKSSDGYITGNQYVDKFNRHLGQDGGALAAIQNAAPTGGGMPQGALAFSGDAPAGPQAQPTGGAQDAPGVLFQGEGPNKTMQVGAMLANAGAAIAGISNPGAGANLRAIAQGISSQGQGKYQYQMGANGQLVRINKETGAVDSIAIPGGQKGNFGVVMGKDSVGNPIPLGKINHDTGEYAPYASQATGSQAGPQIGGDPNLTGQERLASMSPEDQREVTAMLEGRGQPLTSLSLRDPKLRARYEAARAVDPAFDTAKYAARQKTVGGLAQSTPGSLGGQLDSSAAMISHVTDLADDYIKLHNSSGYGATLLNGAKNFTSASGSERDQLLKSIATHSMNFSGEVTKQLSGAPGGQEERQRRVDLINQPNGAPSTQAAALEAELMDAINKRQATLDRVKDTMGEAFVAQNPRFAKQEEALAKAKQKLEELRRGPAINDEAKPEAAPQLGQGWKYLGTK
jgi:hypothetical protein